jgi:ABC-type polysaccharide/polyol phosphate transport system ATPase subunit
VKIEEKHIFGAHGNYRIDYVNEPEKAAAVRFRGVAKRFRIYSSDGQKFLMMFSARRRRTIPLETYLKGLDVAIERGEYVNVCGNYPHPLDAFGDILLNIVYPDRGEVWVNGRVGSIKSMKSGFVKFLTATENIRRMSALNLLGRDETDELLSRVAAFTELPAARMDIPFGKLHTRAQGKIRSAYYLLCGHDILYMDEALPKVDKDYTDKCEAYLKALLADGKICVIRRSRNPGGSKLITRALFFGKNGLVYDGGVKTARKLFAEEEARLVRREKRDERRERE